MQSLTKKLDNERVVGGASGSGQHRREDTQSRSKSPMQPWKNMPRQMPPSMKDVYVPSAASIPVNRKSLSRGKSGGTSNPAVGNKQVSIKQGLKTTMTANSGQYFAHGSVSGKGTVTGKNGKGNMPQAHGGLHLVPRFVHVGPPPEPRSTTYPMAAAQRHRAVLHTRARAPSVPRRARRAASGAEVRADEGELLSLAEAEGLREVAQLLHEVGRGLRLLHRHEPLLLRPELACGGKAGPSTRDRHVRGAPRARGAPGGRRLSSPQ